MSCLIHVAVVHLVVVSVFADVAVAATITSDEVDAADDGDGDGEYDNDDDNGDDDDDNEGEDKDGDDDDDADDDKVFKFWRKRIPKRFRKLWMYFHIFLIMFGPSQRNVWIAFWYITR